MSVRAARVRAAKGTGGDRACAAGRLPLLRLAVSFLIGVSGAGAIPACGQDSQATHVTALENRFFFRIYEHDPLEKRLERLELLVFGATQPGSSAERLNRLRLTIADRDRRAAETLSGSQKPPAAGSGTSSKPTQSSQYPVLNTLEWRVIKRTYPSDTLDQRLERLETKLFGAASPAMSYADRVDRLKRTVGIGVAQGAPPPVVGPKPKARPRGDDNIAGEPWTYGSPLLPDFMPPGRFSMPFLDQVPPQFAELFRELDRQMESFKRMPPGRYRFDPGTGMWISPDSGKKFKMEDLPEVSPAPSLEPGKLPPYYDPNSI